MDAINFKNVSFAYEENSKNVLSNINLTVTEGQFICLLGHNGSGKSTLAKLINCLLLPTNGSVDVYGLSTKDPKNMFEIRKLAGMVFQNPDNQMIATIVEDDVAFGPENIGMPRQTIAENIDFALTATDMQEFRHKSATRLSGGQKQRVAIAGVLAIRPKILILDESTAMLDPKGRLEVMQVAKKLNKECGMTVICITHYMDEAKDADYIYVMNKGKIAMQGTPKEILLKTNQLKECGLDTTRSNTIACKLNCLGFDLPKNIITCEELTQWLCKLVQKT